jgi:hypothetical protein
MINPPNRNIVFLFLSWPIEDDPSHSIENNEPEKIAEIVVEDE